MTRPHDTDEPFRDHARRFLADALVDLAAAGRLHYERSEPPWLDEFVVADVVGDEGLDRLAAAVRAAFPARFEPERLGLNVELRYYGVALVRAVVALSRVRGENASADSDSSVECIEELIRLLDDAKTTFRVVQLVADLDVAAVDGAAIEGIQLHAAPWPQRMIIGRFLPEAVHVNRPLDIEVGQKRPAALLVGEARADDPWEITRPVTTRMLRVLAAIRLATGGTVAETAQFQGEPSMVHRSRPTAHEIPWHSDLTDWFHRPAVVSPDMLPGLERLAALVESSSSKTPALAIAIGRFNRSFRPAIWQDAVVDLAVALEAAFAGDTRQELTLALRSRSAQLLATAADPPTSIWDDVEALYAIRSAVVHGTVVRKRLWDAVFTRVRLPRKSHWDTERIFGAKDRWRDLLRRAILARIVLGALNEHDPDLWPAKLDRALIDRTSQDKLREAIAERLEGLGVRGAEQPATPLRDLLYGDSTTPPAP